MQARSPRAVHDELYAAMQTFEKEWERVKNAEAASAFCDAVEAAQTVTAAFEQEKNERDSDFHFQVLLLKLLLGTASLQLRYAQEETQASIDECLAQAETHEVELDTVLAAGTALVCPSCREDLYAVTTRLTARDVLADDGTLLAPAHSRIPRRLPWAVLECPQCNSGLCVGKRLFIRAAS